MTPTYYSMCPACTLTVRFKTTMTCPRCAKAFMEDISWDEVPQDTVERSDVEGDPQ